MAPVGQVAQVHSAHMSAQQLYPNDDMFDKFAVLRAPPNEDKFAVLRALDDSQLMAEVARRNLNRAARCRARCS